MDDHVMTMRSLIRLPARSAESAQCRDLLGPILASAAVTLDGTATTIALPAIGRDLYGSPSTLQWIVNAPLLALAAMLLPAGTLADRYGRLRVMRVGLAGFVGASVACAFAGTDVEIIGAKFAQGAGGALVLPAALAVLRGAYSEHAPRTRLFGTWAAWTGAAGAAGPLVAGMLVDAVSWRAVFLVSGGAGLLALLLLNREEPVEAICRPVPVPAIATLGLMLLLGTVAYFLMHAPGASLTPARLAAPAALALVGAVGLSRDRHRRLLFPPELLEARNCLPANATSFALYFGMFGVSFLLVVYVQVVLGHSALWAAIVLSPISLMLLFAERLGRLTPSVGTRSVIAAGALSAAGGIALLGGTVHPVPLWSDIVVGTALFGFGISLAVSALTHAAVAAVPDACAGAASGLNHAVVRASGLVSVPLLGSIAAPGLSDAFSADGIQRAMIVCAGVVAVGGVWGSALIRDEEPGGVTAAG